MSAVTMLLNQPEPGALAAQLIGLATAGAAAAEHAALLAVLAASPPSTAEPAAGNVRAKIMVNLLEACKLAAPILASTGSTTAAVPPAAKPAKGAPKGEASQGLISAKAVMQLKQAAEACEAVMLKLSSASGAVGWHPCFAVDCIPHAITCTQPQLLV